MNNYQNGNTSPSRTQEEKIFSKIFEIEKLTRLDKSKFFEIKKQRISEISNTQEKRILIYSVLTKLCAMSGAKQQPDDPQMLLNYELIAVDFNFLSLEEIFLAFKNCFMGRYAQKIQHYDLFNSQYISEVLKTFVSWKADYIKNNAKKIAPKALLQESKPNPQEALKRELKRVVNEFKEFGEISGVNIHVYDYLDELGEMPKSVEFKKMMLNKAKTILIGEAKTQNKKTSTIRQKIKMINKDQHERAVNKAKEIILIEYLKNKYGNKKQ